MARRVFLHIGLPKTGTTFLQTMMWHNRGELRTQGFLYPGARRFDHFMAAQAARGVGGPKRQAQAAAWDDLVRSLQRWDGDGLVSHEFFSMASREQAQAAVDRLEPAEVHVVVTARDYVRQFPAVWQEAVKISTDRSFDAFMERVLAFDTKGAWGWQSQDLPAVLARWAPTVPRERFHLITVPPPSAPRSLLWDRWREVLGFDDTGFDRDVSFGNESLGVCQVALVRHLWSYLTDDLATDGTVRHRWLRQYFGHEVLVPQGGERFGLRPEHAARLRELSIEAVATIEKEGYAVVGDLAELVPAEEQPVRPHPDDVTTEEMLDVASRAIDRMILDVRDLTTERDALRRRLAKRGRGGGPARAGGLVRRGGRRVQRLIQTRRMS